MYVELRRNLDFIESFRLVEGFKSFDTAFVVAALGKKPGFLDVDMSLKLVLCEMSVSIESNIFDLFAIAFFDCVQNGDPIRPSARFRIDLNIEKTFLAESF